MALTKKTYSLNPQRTGMARLVDGVSYSQRGGDHTVLTLLRPWEEAARYPLVVFVQGSAWTTPDRGYEIPQLARLAQRGYVVATVCHRDATQGNPFPAFLQDVKTAIRFLRIHAEQYSIDPERVCIYGTSSGGNTALLVGATGDDPRYQTDEYPGVSDAVRCVAACFGPTDLTMIPDMQSPLDPIFAGLSGSRDPKEVLREMSPLFALSKEKPFPPCVIAHGTGDDVVPYFMATKMAKKLADYGNEVRLLTVTDAPHEDTFWSWPLIEDIYDFIQTHL